MKLWPIAEDNENFNIIGIISGLDVKYRIPDIKSYVRMEMMIDSSLHLLVQQYHNKSLLLFDNE